MVLLWEVLAKTIMMKNWPNGCSATVAGDDSGGGDIHSGGRVIAWHPVMMELGTGTSGGNGGSGTSDGSSSMMMAPLLSDNDGTSSVMTAPLP